MNSNKKISDVYQVIIDISLNNDLPANIRANAVDIIMRSNNTKYTSLAKGLLDQLRHDETKIEENVYNFEIKEEIETLRERAQTTMDGEEMKQILKAIEDYEFEALIKKNIKNPTVYLDSQSVHNSTINQSIIDSMVKFVDSDKDIKEVNNDILITDLMRVNKNLNIDDIQSSLDRIQSDKSTYKNGVEIKDVYNRLIKHIIPVLIRMNS